MERYTSRGKNVHPYFQQQQKTFIHLFLNQNIIKQIFFFHFAHFFSLLMQPDVPQKSIGRPPQLRPQQLQLFVNCFLQSLPATQHGVGGGGGGGG